MLEDEVLDVFADRLRQLGADVLVQNPNQCSAFRFKIGTKTKAPDLVARLGDELLAAECKVRPAGLFAKRSNSLSDFEVMTAVATDIQIQQRLISEAIARISQHNAPPAGLNLTPAVFAAGDFSPFADQLASGTVAAFSINAATRTVVHVGGRPFLL